MAVTLEWVRDHYDTINKDRLIEHDEAILSVKDFLNNIIDKEQLDAVQLAYNQQTLLPAYTTPPPVCTPGARRCRDANTVEQCRADGSGWDIVQACSAGFKCENGSCVPVTTSVTLEWVRDNYDNNPKNRRIDFDEAIKSTQDYSNNRISKEQLDAVQDAYNSQTLLPPSDTPTPPPNMETRTVSLTEGTHTIQVSLNGYDALNATINVTASGVTCVSVIGGACGGAGLPRVSTSGLTVSTYLKAATAVSDVCTWINSIGGFRNLQWSSHILEAYYVYIGASGHSIGFSPVTWDDVLGLYYYYINDTTAGNAKIGCGT